MGRKNKSNSDASSWAESAASEVLKRNKKNYVCQGMWTPSGFFHIGNSRPEIFTPYSVKRALEDKGVKVSQNFIIDDFDAVKKIPPPLGIKKSDEKNFLGVPCALAPSPIKGFNSWADAFVSDVVSVIEKFGVDLNIVSAFQTYKSGKFNSLISESLDKSEKIVEVWNRVAGADKKSSFLPVQVFCDSCGKIYFTDALSWDGKEVEYSCSACGHNGKKSPFDGNGKLHWRVHWVAHWLLHKVDFESGGKDHFSKGSSVDVGHAMIREVFGTPPPYQLPTEFIQIGGRKMAGSVGNVTTLSDWVEVAPPEAFRFLNFNYRPNKVIDFDLSGNSFVLLMGRFERAERIFYGLESAQTDKLSEKIKLDFEFSAISKLPKKMPVKLSYSFAIQLAQLVDFVNDFESLEKILIESKYISKKLSGYEKELFLETLGFAKTWVEKYAPPEFKLGFLEEFDKKLLLGVDSEIISLFTELSKKIEPLDSPDLIQTAVFETAKSAGVSPGNLFKALYLILVGKERGPKIGTLVFALGKEKCIERIKEAGI